MWVLKPIWAYRNRRTILNVKVIHYPFKCEPLSKIGRLSFINIELKPFQECQRFIGQTAIPCCFLGLSFWTYRHFIFWWSLIRTPLGRDSCLPTPSPSIWRFCGKRGNNLLSPSPLGRPHTQDSQRPGDMVTRQAVGWCTCASCWYVCYNRRRRTQQDTFWPFPVMGWFYRKKLRHCLWYPRAILMRAPRKE